MYGSNFADNGTCSLGGVASCLYAKPTNPAYLFQEVEANFTNKLQVGDRVFALSKKLIFVNQRSLNYSTPNRLTGARYIVQDIAKDDIDAFTRIAKEEYIESGFESDAEAFIKKIIAKKGHVYAAKMLAKIISISSDQVAIDAALYVLVGSDEKIYRSITERALFSLVDRADSEILERIIDICGVWGDAELLNKISEEASERLTGGVKHYLALVVGSVHGAIAHA